MNILDTRSEEAFAAGHLKGSVNLPWPQLKTLQNQLPPPGAVLQLVADHSDSERVIEWLISKGYHIERVLSWPLPSFLPLETGKSPHFLWQPNPLLKAFLHWPEVQEQSPLKILDLGCGGGREAVYAALLGHQVTAIEHKPMVLQRAQQLAEAHQVSIEFKHCDLLTQGCFPLAQFDVIMGFRFLERALFPNIKKALKPGGWVLWQTFSQGVEQFGSPKNPRFILKSGELAQIFSGFQVIIDRIETLDDGRPIASFVAQKQKGENNGEH